MEPNELKAMIRDCPLLIRMNDGREYFVEKPEFIHVGDYAAGIHMDLDKAQGSSFKGNVVASLIYIAAVVPNAKKPKRSPRCKTS